MKTTFLTIILGSLFLLFSCKENGKISGQIVYEDSATGLSYKANGAKVKLMLSQDDYYKEHPVDEFTADSEGYYEFTGLGKASYYVYATVTVNGYEYSRLGTIDVSGRKDSKTLNLVLY